MPTLHSPLALCDSSHVSVSPSAPPLCVSLVERGLVLLLLGGAIFRMPHRKFLCHDTSQLTSGLKLRRIAARVNLLSTLSCAQPARDRKGTDGKAATGRGAAELPKELPRHQSRTRREILELVSLVASCLFILCHVLADAVAHLGTCGRAMSPEVSMLCSADIRVT